MKMLNSVAMLGLVAFALPVVAGEEKKSSRRVTVQKLKDGDNESLKKAALWFSTIVGAQVLARQVGWLDTAVANLISAGGAAHLIGDMTENETAKTWGMNGVYLGSAFAILNQGKVPHIKTYMNKGLDTVSGTDRTKQDADKAHKAGVQVNDLVGPVVLAAVIKLVAENLPTLLKATQTVCPPQEPVAAK
jgi:hypothetical protein